MPAVSLMELRRTKSPPCELKPSCSRCYLQHVCLPAGLSAEDRGELDHLAREKRKVRRNAALYVRGERFESLYAIHSGSFMSLGNGQRQEQRKVTGLHLPADLLGLEAIASQVHEYDAIAVEVSEVCVLPYTRLTRLTFGRPSLQTHLMRALSREIVRDDGLVLRLAGMSAEERLAAFLVGLSARYQRLGSDGTQFSVRMQRQHIASYLGLTIETTSRVFSRLERNGLIELQERSVTITDRDRLGRLAAGCSNR